LKLASTQYSVLPTIERIEPARDELLRARLVVTRVHFLRLALGKLRPRDRHRRLLLLLTLPGERELRLGLRQGRLVGPRIDVEQRIAHVDGLLVAHVHGDDLARDLRGNVYGVRVHIGIVGARVVPRVQPPGHAADEGSDGDDADDAEAHDFASGRLRFGGGRRRRLQLAAIGDVVHQRAGRARFS